MSQLSSLEITDRLMAEAVRQHALQDATVEVCETHHSHLAGIDPGSFTSPAPHCFQYEILAESLIMGDSPYRTTIGILCTPGPAQEFWNPGTWRAFVLVGTTVQELTPALGAKASEIDEHVVERLYGHYFLTGTLPDLRTPRAQGGGSHDTLGSEAALSVFRGAGNTDLELLGALSPYLRELPVVPHDKTECQKLIEFCRAHKRAPQHPYELTSGTALTAHIHFHGFPFRCQLGKPFAVTETLVGCLTSRFLRGGGDTAYQIIFAKKGSRDILAQTDLPLYFDSGEGLLRQRTDRVLKQSDNKTVNDIVPFILAGEGTAGDTDLNNETLDQVSDLLGRELSADFCRLLSQGLTDSTGVEIGRGDRLLVFRRKVSQRFLSTFEATEPMMGCLPLGVETPRLAACLFALGRLPTREEALALRESPQPKPPGVSRTSR